VTYPLGDHIVATHNYDLGPQRNIWVQFSGLLEEFRQALSISELQPNPAVVELKGLGKASDGIVDVSIAQVGQHRQNQFALRCGFKLNVTHLNLLFLFKVLRTHWFQRRVEN
jgi:hypothetical protein